MPLRKITGSALNEIFAIGAEHSLYSAEGHWYHHLRAFPGALFDKNGYIVFSSLHDYSTHQSLKHTQDLHVKAGIASLKGYTLFTESQRRTIILNFKDEIDEESVRVIRQIGVIVRDYTLVQQVKKKYDNTCQICGLRLKIDQTLFYSEVHHIKPLGSPYNGPDKIENMLCVCPNCHIQLDLGAIRIDSQKLKLKKHLINEEYISYHNTNIKR